MAFTFKGTYTQNGGDDVAAGTVQIYKRGDASPLASATLDATGSYSLLVSAEEGEMKVIETMTGVPVRTYEASVSRGSVTDTSRDLGTVGGAEQSGAYAPATLTANRQTASYGLVLADAGLVIEMNVASANNLTVPLNATQAFPVGTTIEVMQYGAGQTTIVATGGVTIRSSGGKLKLTAQYSSASLRKIATDEWAVAGELSA